MPACDCTVLCVCCCACSTKRSAVHKDMREAFIRDMDPNGKDFPSSLGDLAEQLKAWRSRLQAELEDRMPQQVGGRGGEGRKKQAALSRCSNAGQVW